MVSTLLVDFERVLQSGYQNAFGCGV